MGFNTLQAFTAIKDAHTPEESARAIIEAIESSRQSEREITDAHLVNDKAAMSTKDDLMQLELRLLTAQTRIETNMAKMQTTLILWMISILVVGLGGLFSTIKLWPLLTAALT